MSEMFLFLVAGGGGAALIVALVQYHQKVMQRLEAAWQKAAALVGGEFVPPAGSWWSRSPMQIVVELDGVTLLVDHYTVSHGKSSTTYTRITAPAKTPPGLMLKIYKEGGLLDGRQGPRGAGRGRRR